MEFSRQLDLFNPSDFKYPVHVIGAGATGSWVTLLLAKIGITNITVHDFDIVEAHNLPNQFYEVSDIGSYKVDALRKNIYNQTGITIHTRNHAVTGTEELEGIVFVLTDTMSSRSDIFKNAIRRNKAVVAMVETRMGLEHGRIYFLNPNSDLEINYYEQTLYTDDEVEDLSACGTSQSVAITATGISQLAVWKVVKFSKGMDNPNETIVDFMSTFTLHTNWKTVALEPPVRLRFDEEVFKKSILKRMIMPDSPIIMKPSDAVGIPMTLKYMNKIRENKDIGFSPIELLSFCATFKIRVHIKYVNLKGEQSERAIEIFEIKHNKIIRAYDCKSNSMRFFKLENILELDIDVLEECEHLKGTPEFENVGDITYNVWKPKVDCFTYENLLLINSKIGDMITKLAEEE